MLHCPRVIARPHPGLMRSLLELRQGIAETKTRWNILLPKLERDLEIKINSIPEFWEKKYEAAAELLSIFRDCLVKIVWVNKSERDRERER
ncbi:hypothetical protein TNCV_1533951 [Trichonephila clavipes]|nr:hypothetical protein TNCV_1533951 [Trichonephila clavipes]